jgi:5-methylcytosine-specific restriction endonuclease McrA
MSESMDDLETREVSRRVWAMEDKRQSKRELPAERSSCCGAAVYVFGVMMRSMPKLIDHWEYECQKCGEPCSLTQTEADHD